MYCSNCKCSNCQTNRYEQTIYDEYVLSFIKNKTLPLAEDYRKLIIFIPTNPSDYPDGYPENRSRNIMNFIFECYSFLKITPGTTNKSPLDYTAEREAFKLIARRWDLEFSYDRIRYVYYCRDLSLDVK